jgi:hypothetical protein
MAFSSSPQHLLKSACLAPMRCHCCSPNHPPAWPDCGWRARATRSPPSSFHSLFLTRSTRPHRPGLTGACALDHIRRLPPGILVPARGCRVDSPMCPSGPPPVPGPEAAVAGLDPPRDAGSMTRPHSSDLSAPAIALLENYGTTAGQPCREDPNTSGETSRPATNAPSGECG